MTVIYGIKNCGTMKKAINWLDENGVDYTFHDYKKAAADEALIKQWIKVVGWELLVNRKGTTWRKLPQETRDNINESLAIELMLENNSLIKRPVVANSGKLLVGFDPDEFKALFS